MSTAIASRPKRKKKAVDRQRPSGNGSWTGVSNSGSCLFVEAGADGIIFSAG